MFEQIKSKLFSYLMRMSDDYDLSRDILQETCLRYLEHYSGKGASPSLIFTIARNIFIDHMRKKSRGRPLRRGPPGQCTRCASPRVLVRGAVRACSRCHAAPGRR